MLLSRHLELWSLRRHPLWLTEYCHIDCFHSHTSSFLLLGPTSAKTRLRVKIIFLRKMMFCKKVVSRRRSSAVKWNQRESRLFEEVARSWQEGFQQSGKSKGFRKPSGRIFPATPLVTTKSFWADRTDSISFTQEWRNFCASCCLRKMVKKSSPVRVVIAIARRTWTTSIQPIEVWRY